MFLPTFAVPGLGVDVEPPHSSPGFFMEDAMSSTPAFGLPPRTMQEMWDAAHKDACPDCGDTGIRSYVSLEYLCNEWETCEPTPIDKTTYCSCAAGFDRQDQDVKRSL